MGVDRREGEKDIGHYKVYVATNLVILLGLGTEEVGHDAHKRYGHMTLVCTSCSYAFRRMQFARLAGS